MMANMNDRFFVADNPGLFLRLVLTIANAVRDWYIRRDMAR